jgi:hypothetical protein
MNLKPTVLSLALVAAIAIAVPALAAGSSVSTVANELAVRALAKARLALLTARSAKSQSRVAVRTAQAAGNTANEAKAAAREGTEAKALASATKGELDSTHVQSGFAAGATTTESTAYVQLAGGPSVTVNVPPSGLIEVWAQVNFEDEGAVALFEDGQRMPGQSAQCAPEEEGAALLATFGTESEEVTVSTPSNVSLNFFGGGPSFICGSFGPPSSVLFQTSPGKHTYELRYKAAPPCGCGGGGEATFSNRLLRVAGRL